MRASINKMWPAGVVAAWLALAVSTGALAATPVTFQLNWVAGGANAGFASAVAQGFYKDAGLDVTLVQGNGSGNTAQLVANGRAQLAYADAVAITQLIAKGAPMKVVSTIYQSNPNEVSALKKTGIKSIKDLSGKKVGVPSGLVADDDAAALPQGQQPEGIGHDADEHAAGVDGARSAAGPGGRHPRVGRRVPDPARGAGCGARQLPLRRLRRADRQHVDLRQRRVPQGKPRPGEEVHRGEPQGLELRARQPRTRR